MGAQGSKEVKEQRHLGVNPPFAIAANGRMRLGSFKRGSAKKVQREARCQDGRISSPLSDHSIQSSASHPTPTRTPNRVSGAREHGVSRDHASSTHKRVIHAEKDAGSVMKTPLARKHKSPRDHNRFAVNKVESAAAAAAAAAARAAEAASRDNDAKPAAASPGAARAAEAAQKVVETLQNEQKRLSSGYDAMSVVIGHLVNYYDALETPRLKEQLAQALEQRTEAALARDEMSFKVAGLEHDLATLKATTDAQFQARDQQDEQEKLQALERSKLARDELDEQVNQLKKLHEEQEAAIVVKMTAEHKENTDLLIAAHQAQLAQVQEECQRQCDETKAELDSVRRKSILIESLVNSEGEDTRLQASASKCTQLQKEVDSLRVVLDIRCQELQALRRKHAVLSRDAEELTVEKKKVDTLQARLEDLEIRLNKKREDERVALSDAKSWRDNYEHELVASRKLSQLNEELSWTLKNKVRAYNQLKAMSATHNPECEHSMDMLRQEWSSRSLPAPRCAVVADDTLVDDEKDVSNSNAAGHQVSNVLERSDSISWIYQLDDNPEDMAAKLSCMVPKKPMPSALMKLRKVTNSEENAEVTQNWANRSPKHTSTPLKKIADFQVEMPSDVLIELDDSDYPMKELEAMEKTLAFPNPLPIPSPGLSPSPTNEPLSLRGAAPVPKDAGGEAMISEETSEEEDFPPC